MSHHPSWNDVPGAVVCVRSGPAPAIGMFGEFTNAMTARLNAFLDHLPALLERIRYVSYDDAGADCEALARRLVDRFGRRWLSTCTFTAIPRGGVIVLGMLATALGLSPDQLRVGGSSEPDGPLVIVDDFALTGHRFGDYLAGWRQADVVFAHLYSHPDLRASIETREPRVTACVAARDLDDWGPRLHGDGYPSWQEFWRERAGQRYWMGIPDYLCFAWKEPDRPFWNPVTDRLEEGWRFMPAELCLSNRAQPAAPSAAVQIQPIARGPVRPVDTVMYATVGDSLVVADAETGGAIELDGVAADMWHAVVEHGAVRDAAHALAEVYAHDEDALARDVAGFVHSLTERGLLGGAP